MNVNPDNESAESKKREQERRTEIAMMNHLTEKYPMEAYREARKLTPDFEAIPRQTLVDRIT